MDDLSFRVRGGRVTGFLGPNGAGKTTTLRMLLGLVTPTAGTATFGGRRYVDLADPIRHVGAVLEASSAHRGRTGRNHLRMICRAAGLPDSRADEMLAVVGLTPAAKRKFKGYSLGMKQRLGIAAAMLGDPRVLILDEPANGLDPEGIRWMRDLLKALAAEGRTVLVSSHLLGEMQQLADDVVIVAAGQADPAGPGRRGARLDGRGARCGCARRSPSRADRRAGRRWTRPSPRRPTGRCWSPAPTPPRSGTPPSPPRSSCTSWPTSAATWNRSSCSSRPERRASDEPGQGGAVQDPHHLALVDLRPRPGPAVRGQHPG